MAVGAVATKAALTLAKSKTGRKILAFAAVTVVLLPILVVAVPVVVLTALAPSLVAAVIPGGEGGESATGCEDAAQCQVSGDAQELASQIMAYSATGKVAWLDVRFRQQVQAYANGGAVSPECTLDPRVLQVILLAVQREGSVGISSLNRRCTGQTPGAGRASYHWKGKAVDFYSLGGRVIHTSSEPQVLDLIQFLGPIVPKGSGVGQIQCRRPSPSGTSTSSATPATTSTSRCRSTMPRC